MWLVLIDNKMHKGLATSDDVVNLIFNSTNDWMFCSYLQDYLADKEVDFEEGFELPKRGISLYVFKYR